mmetsp:Transcript_5977/g.14240  ORF Transcript_5977/g.14240 Transcript_5977/m.14240 type:complete len:277 (-) Transcript_5977:122-952(-)
MSRPISSQTSTTHASAEHCPAMKLVQASWTAWSCASLLPPKATAGSAGASVVSRLPVSSQLQHLRASRVVALFSSAVHALPAVVFQYVECHRLRQVGHRRMGTVKPQPSMAPSTHRDRHPAHSRPVQSAAQEDDLVTRPTVSWHASHTPTSPSCAGASGHSPPNSTTTACSGGGPGPGPGSGAGSGARPGASTSVAGADRCRQSTTGGGGVEHRSSPGPPGSDPVRSSGLTAEASDTVDSDSVRRSGCAHRLGWASTQAQQAWKSHWKQCQASTPG